MALVTTDSFFVLGNIVRFKTRPSVDGAPFCMAEVISAPGAGAPPNRHPGDEEAFYVVSGRYAFEIDGEKIEAEAGRFVPVPKGGLHTFRNISATPSRLITITWPGTIHEAFFSEVGLPLALRDSRISSAPGSM